jgi:hypothetical protein
MPIMQKVEKRKPNHESTKDGKHERRRGVFALPPIKNQQSKIENS